MKKIAFLMIFLCAQLTSKAQKMEGKDFYLLLAKVLESNSMDSINLNTTVYWCLGSNSHWNANIKKIGDLIKVDFYSRRPKDRTKPWPLNEVESEVEPVLDTTYTVTKKTLLKRIKEEAAEIQTRPVAMEESFKFIIEEGTSKNEYFVRRGEGLYILLRFDKSWKAYMDSIRSSLYRD